MQVSQKGQFRPQHTPGGTCAAVEGALQDTERYLLPKGTSDGHGAVAALDTRHVDDPGGIKKELSTDTCTADTDEKHFQKEAELLKHSSLGTENKTSANSMSST